MEKNIQRNIVTGFVALFIVAAIIGMMIGSQVSSSMGGYSFFNLFGTSGGQSAVTPGVVTHFINQTNCTDSDGGIVAYIKGTVNNNSNYTDFCWYNGTKVKNSSVLAEFYCFENGPMRTLIYCPRKCFDGRCLNVTDIVLGYFDHSPGVEIDSDGNGRSPCLGTAVQPYYSPGSCSVGCTTDMCKALCKSLNGATCTSSSQHCVPIGGGETDCYCICAGPGGGPQNIV